MLVVSRRIGEEIMVPQFGIVFRILDVRGSKVRLGITAPPDVRVHRRELWERIQSGEVKERELPAAHVMEVDMDMMADGAISTT